MKKIKFSIMFFALFLMGFSNNVKAEEVGSNVEVNENEKFYSSEFDAFVNAFKLSDSGELVELTTKEYEDLDLNYESDKDEVDSVIKEDDQPLITPRDSFRSWLVFVPTTNTSYVGDPIKVSSDISCTTPSCSLGHGVTYSKSIAVTYGAATSSEKALIKSALNINFTSAKAVTNSFTFNLKKGQKGYVAFKPYKIRKDGYYKECYNQGMGCRKLSKTGYARVPKKLSDGNADGVFYFVHKK